MKYLSLFSGIGGFELGIQQAYELSKMGIESKDSTDSASKSSQHGERPLCIGYSEIDKYAIQIYQKHFPSHKNNGDITKIKAEELPDFDLVCGGVPCQSWSIAGKRGGFEDPRGNMWFECFKVLRAKRPKYFIFENVKGLLSHDGGRSMERICEGLCESGYALDFEVLNSKNFGVPQNRERVYIVGIRLDLLDDCQVF
jgi:DNA (cytosine-5)-methyltransferase 1